MDFSNISILNLLPPNLAKDPGVKMAAQAFDKALQEIIISKIPDVGIIPNLVLDKIVNETLIDMLAWQFHVDFYEPDLPIETKRALVLNSLSWHTRKGTPSVVEEIVSTVFSRAKIEEWFEYGGLPYRFRVSTEEQMPDEETVRKLIRAINSVKNTRSFLDTLTQMNDFYDEVIIEDILEIIRARTKFTDSFNHSGIKFNGEIKHNGKYPAGRFIRDKFSLILRPDNFVDIFETRLRHNGVFKADGSHKFNGPGRIGDAFKLFINHGYKDNFDVTDVEKIKINTELQDYFSTQIKFNGVHKHNGAIQASAARELFSIVIKNAEPFVDTFYTELRHNGMVKADGSHTFGGAGRISDLPVKMKGRLDFEDRVVMSDPFTLEIKKYIDLKDFFPTRFRFDGTFKHDGGITASGSSEHLRIFVMGLNAVDKHKTRLKHNGTIKADGSHKFNGNTGMGDVLSVSTPYKYHDSISAADGHTEKIKITNLRDEVAARELSEIKASMATEDREEMREDFFIGMRFHRKHNGKYKANGQINFNSGILIPV